MRRLACWDRKGVTQRRWDKNEGVNFYISIEKGAAVVIKRNGKERVEYVVKEDEAVEMGISKKIRRENSWGIKEGKVLGGESR